MRKNDIYFIIEGLIAHRGLHNDETPENSMAAFKKAVARGYSIELDVHLVDGEVYVFHDDNLKRMTGVNSEIKNCSRKDIEKLRLKNTSEKIPKLQEVLDFVNDKVPVIVEIKSDVPAKLVGPAVLRILSDYTGRFVIKSFDPRIVHYFKRHAKNIGRGQLATGNNFFLKYMFLNFWTRPDFISYDIRELPNWRVEYIRRRMPVLGWTIRNRNELAKAKRNCDGYICEDFLS